MTTLHRKQKNHICYVFFYSIIAALLIFSSSNLYAGNKSIPSTGYIILPVTVNLDNFEKVLDEELNSFKETRIDRIKKGRMSITIKHTTKLKRTGSVITKIEDGNLTTTIPISFSIKGETRLARGSVKGKMNLSLIFTINKNSQENIKISIKPRILWKNKPKLFGIKFKFIQKKIETAIINSFRKTESKIKDQIISELNILHQLHDNPPTWLDLGIQSIYLSQPVEKNRLLHFIAGATLKPTIKVAKKMESNPKKWIPISLPPTDQPGMLLFPQFIIPYNQLEDIITNSHLTEIDKFKVLATASHITPIAPNTLKTQISFKLLPKGWIRALNVFGLLEGSLQVDIVTRFIDDKESAIPLVEVIKTRISSENRLLSLIFDLSCISSNISEKIRQALSALKNLQPGRSFQKKSKYFNFSLPIDYANIYKIEAEEEQLVIGLMLSGKPRIQILTN